ncbi:hypothetical protein B0H15DRAFT_869198 [Mycena belliarum]|uniref:MYND-type domain-containing protein n=1 Tax=Mycena belliarum TaxID=1033014 RepID=A0AAD6TN83_9AGAR|nr:hypothetical protein B0H15DRAFT_869198 [Mycena belliae]
MDNCIVCGRYAEARCSACRGVRYCGSQCQKQDWKSHKSDCKSFQVATLNVVGAGGNVQEKPVPTHCTGCKLKFGSEIGKRDELCPDCGYAACADCACHNRRGTCYCENSNFGHKYCGRVPEWYHCSSRTGRVYRGDNHPDPYDAELHAVPAAQWEAAPRTCGNCWQTKLCLKRGYQCKYWMCQ